MITKIIDLQGIKAKNAFVVMGIRCCYGFVYQFITLGTGTRRELLKQFSAYSTAGADTPTDFQRWDGKVYTAGELLQVVNDTCKDAISLEDFLQLNDCMGMACYLSRDGQNALDGEYVVHTSEDLDEWIQTAQNQAEAYDGVTLNFHPLGTDHFVHTDSRAEDKYFVRGKGKYVMHKENTTYYYSFQNAPQLSWDEAVRLVASHPGFSMVPAKKSTCVYVVRRTAGAYAGYYVSKMTKNTVSYACDVCRAHAYTTRRAAEDAASRFLEERGAVVEKVCLKEAE